MNFRIFQTDRFTMDFGIGPQQLLDLTIRCMGMNIQKVVMIFSSAAEVFLEKLRENFGSPSL